MTYRQKIDDFLKSIEEECGPIPKFAQNLQRPKNKVYYSGPYFDRNELSAAIETLLFGNWSVNGEKTNEFERKFAELIGEKDAISCNSGSSANLVLITAAKEHFKWKDGDEIIVSPAGFPTTVSPICQNNLKPVFADIEWNTLNFDLNEVEKKITSRTVAIFVSPVLGNPPDIDRLLEIKNKYNIQLILDSCDSLGSKWNGINIQKYFFASSYSFYPAHHITILQGGMVTSDNEDFMAICQSLTTWSRSCWCRGKANLLPNGVCGKRFSNWLENYDGKVDHKYVFQRMGYNLQILDLQAAIGVEQLKKFPEMENSRRQNFIKINQLLTRLNKFSFPSSLQKADPSWFGVPIICGSQSEKEKFVSYLEKNGIQTRNYFAGNLLIHKGFAHLDSYLNYPNANRVLSNVLFLGCWPGYTEENLTYIEEVFNKYV